MLPTSAEKAIYSEGLKTIDGTQKGGRINVLPPLIVVLLNYLAILFAAIYLPVKSATAITFSSQTCRFRVAL